MTNRAKSALVVLRAGGYFRHALERHYMGGEKFTTRLRYADGSVVKGIGWATRAELEEAGLLKQRECFRSSAFPREWVLNEETAAVAA